MKIKYDIGFGETETCNFNSVEQMIAAFRAAYGAATAARINIISTEPVDRDFSGMASYFEQYGTANE